MTNFEKSEDAELRAYQVISEYSHHTLMHSSFCIMALKSRRQLDHKSMRWWSISLTLSCDYLQWWDFIFWSEIVCFLLPIFLWCIFFSFRSLIPHSYSVRDGHKCHFLLSVLLILTDNTDTVLFSQRCYFNGHYTCEFGNKKANSRVGRDVVVSVASFGRDTDLRFTIPKCLIWLIFIIFTTQEDALV